MSVLRVIIVMGVVAVQSNASFDCCSLRVLSVMSVKSDINVKKTSSLY